MARSIIAPAERVTNLRWGIALVLGFGFFVTSLDRSALSVASGPLRSQLGIGAAEFGLLSSVYLWVYAFAQLPLGIVLDRIGITLVTRGAALVWGTAALLSSFAPNLVVLAGSRALLGAGEAPLYPAGAKAVGYWFPRTERGFATAIVDGGSKLSLGIGALFCSWSTLHFGWRSAFVVTAALALVFVWLFSLFYRDPGSDARLTFAEAQYIRTGEGEPSVPAGETPRDPGLPFLFGQRKVWGFSLGLCAYEYLFALFLTWLPAYFASTFSLDVVSAGGYTFAIWIVAAVCEIGIGGILVDTLAKRGADVDRIRSAFLALGLILGLGVTGAAFTHDVHVALAWVALAAAGIGIHAATAWSIPGLIAPRNATARIAALGNGVGTLARIAAPVVTGSLVATTGSFGTAFVTAAVVVGIGIVAYLFVLGRPEKIREPLFF